MNPVSKTDFFDLDHFVQRGKQVLEFTKQSIKNRQQTKVNPQFKKGFLRNALSKSPPEQSVQLQDIFEEIKTKITPGILNWQSSKFFAYYPSIVSESSVYADIFALAFNNPSFNYAASPSHTELQSVVVDWTVEALGLPQKFLLKNSGGGLIMPAASTSIFQIVHAAKISKLNKLGIALNNPSSLNLVAYVSQTAHISTQKALMLKDIHHRRTVPCVYDQKIRNYIVDLQKLEEMIQQDIKNGLIPFFYGASIGTTWSGAIDQIPELSQVCKKYGMWLNADAAYIGPTWICEEYRSTQKGIENADSLQINFSKMAFVGIGGSLLYVANKMQFKQTINLIKQFSLYKQQQADTCGVSEHKDWKLDQSKTPLSFRIYFLFKFFGLEKIRQSFRYRQSLSKHLEKLIEESRHFQLYSKRSFTLLCFRLKGQNSNEITKQLSARINNIEQGYTTSASFKDDFILRMVIGNPKTTIEEIDAWWNRVNTITEQFMNEIRQ